MTIFGAEIRQLLYQAKLTDLVSFAFSDDGSSVEIHPVMHRDGQRVSFAEALSITVKVTKVLEAGGIRPMVSGYTLATRWAIG
jgi:hypothetical protein